MQALAAGVEAQGAVVFGDVHIESDVRVGHADIGSFARFLPELVDDGILHLIGHELGVFELLGEDHGVDSKGLVKTQVLGPVDSLHLVVYVIG